MSKQFNPFPDVSCQYGSPMGRRSDNPANLQDVSRSKLRARPMGGDGYYDKGGAYWGSSSEGKVWGVWAWLDGEVVCVYVRARSRDAAIDAVLNQE